ncbi:MAG: hypothetical protein ABFS45_06475 [Pseudomonadota bacterium]
MRRNFEQDTEYYLDRFSFVDLPPWWNERLEPFRNRFFVAGGSVSSADLTLEAQLNLALPLGKGFSAGFHYLESENQTNQYQRVAPALEYQLSPATSVFAMIEGTVEKEEADMSFGMNLFHTERGRTRLMFTFVDFSDGKARDFEYTKNPYGLKVSGDYRWDGGSEIYYEADAQLPFEQRLLIDDELFSMWRVIALGETRFALSGRDKLVVAVYFEFTQKALEPGDMDSPLAEDFDGDMERMRLEWWRKVSNDYQWAMGLSWLRLRNEGARINDPAQNLEEHRNELLYVARVRIRLTGFALFEPNIWAGYVDYQNQLGGVTVNKSFDGFQGKIGLPLVLRFSKEALFSINPTFQLDQLSFGGGSVQFQAKF